MNELQKATVTVLEGLPSNTVVSIFTSFYGKSLLNEEFAKFVLDMSNIYFGFDTGDDDEVDECKEEEDEE